MAILQNNETDNLNGLHPNGFTSNDAFNESEFNQKRIDAIRDIIRTHLIPLKAVSNCDTACSYSLKHTIERYAYVTGNAILGNYITNGECIYAMYQEGYIFEKEPHGQNAYFNVSKKSVEVLKAVVKRLDK